MPIDKCWEIPDTVDPSLIYSDKSHSITLSEIKDHIINNNNKPIPSKRVLSTLLQTEATNWPEFLQQINNNRLDIEYLVIGLKAKERELMEKGRFFALLSWQLREYFVFD